MSYDDPPAWGWFSKLLESQARYEKMMKAFCTKRGLVYCGDPAQPIIDAVKANGGEADKRLGLLVLSPEQVGREVKPTK